MGNLFLSLALLVDGDDLSEPCHDLLEPRLVSHVQEPNQSLKGRSLPAAVQQDGIVVNCALTGSSLGSCMTTIMESKAKADVRCKVAY